MKNLKSGNKLRTIMSLASVAVFGTVTGLAQAANTGTPLAVNIVEYSNDNLLVQLSNGTNYNATTSAPAGCSSANADTLKVWASMAQSALLSGKKLFIYFHTCGVPYIDFMDIYN